MAGPGNKEAVDLVHQSEPAEVNGTEGDDTSLYGLLVFRAYP